MGVTDSWSVDEVCDFLNRLQLGHLSPAFKENAIAGEDLAGLTDDDLQNELGCKPLQVKKIRRELASANNSSATPAQVPPAQAPPTSAPPASAPPAQVPSGAAPPQYYYPPPQAQPPPAGYPPAGYPPAGYPPNSYAPSGAPQTAAPASAPMAGSPTGAKPVSPADLREYQQLNQTIRKLKSEGVTLLTTFVLSSCSRDHSDFTCSSSAYRLRRNWRESKRPCALSKPAAMEHTKS
mmetsp:Transcript_1460/g.2272  ORF Transcript_1460/g.2272 Transcript_1460/m.2272 type:complete len:236 (+) Transcript_1460:204-911(+)